MAKVIGKVNMDVVKKWQDNKEKAKWAKLRKEWRQVEHAKRHSFHNTQLRDQLAAGGF